MRRLPWWGAGLVAVAIAYAVLAAGLALTQAVTDAECGLPGLELLVFLATLLLHPWAGFFGASAPGRPVKALLLGFPVGIVAVLADLLALGPPVFPDLNCGDDPFRGLGGLVVTGAAAALYARAGTSARNPSISSATRSGRSSGRK